jgi:hypothetical protein
MRAVVNRNANACLNSFLYKLIIKFNSLFSIPYFNVPTQQLQEPITDPAQEDEIYT